MGIGYEISESLVEIFKAAKVPVEFETEKCRSRCLRENRRINTRQSL